LLATSLNAAQPALVLQITVDQLRGGMLEQSSDRFGPSGFRYLLDNGTVYANAHYRHANTVTGAGHATLATGANAAGNGIVANDWYDYEAGRAVNCVEDRNSFLLGDTDKPSLGRSPARLASSTLADQLVLASAGRSRAFGVSTKDRGAIFLAGRNGKAFWYSRRNGSYITSTWYYESMPEWMQQWNSRGPADAYNGYTWNLLDEAASYRALGHDDRPFERPRGGIGNTFPHRLVKQDAPVFYSALRYTPVADELTLAFTMELVRQEQIGRRAATDYLAVSFSSTDYIGHAFGPTSLEAEDNLLRLDRVIERLLAFIDGLVGLENTLIVLSSDHGVGIAPEVMAEYGFDVSRLGMRREMQRLDTRLQAHFGTERKLIIEYLKPWVFFDLAAIEEAGLDLQTVESEAARMLQETTGIRHAVTRSSLLEGGSTNSPVMQAVQSAFNARNAGQLFVINEPYWYISNDPHSDAATHGTPYGYDTHVPIILAGPGIPAQVVQRKVAPRDIAPTLAALLEIPPPDAYAGSVLTEVLQQPSP
jgi:predicted AlkP superfamily pyrophosphatase or phosphodiesterase